MVEKKNMYSRVFTRYLFCIVMLLYIIVPVKAAEKLVCDFESGFFGFRSIRDDVTVSISDRSATEGKSGKSLHIRGTVSQGDTYAESILMPLQEYNLYRISVTIQINTITKNDQNTPLPFSFPYIRCEFLTENIESNLGKAELRIQDNKPGMWQKLEGEFRAPWGTRQCRIIIANDNTSKNIKASSIKTDFHIDNIIIEQIPFYTMRDKYYLRILPKSLQKTQGVHPRLYLTDVRIAEFREKAQSTHAVLWNNLKEKADDLINRKPPAWQGNNEGIYDEQWWMAGNSSSMITLAMVFLMTEDETYLQAARDWALTTCEYPGWGIGWADGIDCMTGHNLYGLAVVYDWLYNYLDEDALNTIRNTLITRASVMYDAASKGTIVPNKEEFSVRPWPEWEEAWLQNHLWVNSTGILAAGLALFDEVDGARFWIGFAKNKFERTMNYLGPDGASHEGINYWSYGIEHLFKSMYLLRDLLDEDLYNTEWFKNTARYRLYTSIPMHAWRRGSTTVNYGDSHPRDSTGPGHMLRALAGEYGDKNAQWLASALDESGAPNTDNYWLNLIWYDHSVPEIPPVDLPTLFHFTDTGFVSARSDWSGDESFLFFKCGPYIGHKAIEIMNYSATSAHHTHPDQNSFMLFGAGEWLIRDDGNYGKYTGQHNTLIIDGGEQLGGGDSIFDGVFLHAMKRKPRILYSSSTPDMDHVIGEAAEAYNPDMDLKKFTRHLIYLKPDVLIVADDILLNSLHNLELRFHPGPQETEQSGDAFFTRTEKSILRVEPLTPENVEITAQKHDLIDRRYNKSEMLSITLKKQDDTWRNAVAFSWTGANGKPIDVEIDINGDLWTFTMDSRKVILDWSTNETVFTR
ncbi:DUF4962 domain-containing protein [Candidatus Latescibacterota bacterium]